MARRRRPPRIKLRHKPGTSPGILKPKIDGLAPDIQVIRFNSSFYDECSAENIEHIRRMMEADCTTWINVHGLGDVKTLSQLGKLLGLHQLALEDAVNLQQRAKVEDYDDHLFIVLRMVSYGQHLTFEQISLFVGDGFVVSIQERPGDCLDPVRNRLRKNRKRIRSSGADYLAYAMIDAIIDSYFPVVDRYGEKMERVDEQLTDGRHTNFMDVLHLIRGDLMALRRSIRPLRDEMSLLISEPNTIISPDTQIYLRDCYDHSIQLIDLLDNYRELCSDLRDYYMSLVSNRMNEVMKVLTIIGTIFIPLGFIAGLYGMNFNTHLPGNMPELNWPYGYVFAIGVMVVVALGLLWFVWKQGWLGSDRKPIEFDSDSEK
jgi:magnesium transporter